MDSSGMEPYPEYKDSGVEWIGEIPQHWDIRRSKHIINCIKGKSPTKYVGLEPNDLSLPYLSMEYLRDKTKIPTHYEVENNSIIANKGDLLVLWDGSNAGEFILSKKGILSSTMAKICLIKKYNHEFLFYVLKTNEKYLKDMSIGMGIPHVDSNVLNNLLFVAPSSQEQQAIATFLDRETSRIDALVEKKQQFIELLEERRSALISHAVTKGLDPDVPMKDSGIEWIGEIPEHWDVRKTSRSFKIIGSGTTPYSDTLEYYDNGDIPWILTGDLNDTILKNTSKKITNSALVNHSSLKLYNKNTLIIAMYGATIGKVSLIDFQGCTNQACCALNKSDYFIQRFVYYWFLTNRNNIIRLSYGGGQPNISQEIIKSLKIQSPPLQEQQAIANYLDRETSQIDNLIEKTKQSIEYLKEYRTALISSAVTGKIDVRGTVSD
jgi:type I restriction enzyme S subunit